MNRKFVSKSNRVLRKVLNSKENLDILQDFIETFLKIKVKEIILNPYLEKQSNHLPSPENFGIADVRIKLQNEEELNVGIQFIDGYYAQNKMLLYYAQIHSNQLEYQDHRKVAKTITINLLDFNYLKTGNYFNKIVIPSKTDYQVELCVLELPKFMASEKSILNKQEAWMAYLCGGQEDIIVEVLKNFNKINKLDHLLEEYWKNETMD